VNESIGLSPSVYGGGGSPSSELCSPFGSRTKGDLFSATTAEDGSGSSRPPSEGGETKAGGEAQPGSKAVGSGRWLSLIEGKTSDEKGGGQEEAKLEDEASE
jgi:hypothetical protein